MEYCSFTDLPQFLRDYITDMVGADAADWVRGPVPALQGRSVLELLNQEGLEATVEFVENVGGYLGIPYELQVPEEYLAPRRSKAS